MLNLVLKFTTYISIYIIEQRQKIIMKLVFERRDKIAHRACSGFTQRKYNPLFFSQSSMDSSVFSRRCN